MPNLKIYVDESLYPGVREPLSQTLGQVRDLLCRELAVDVPACQFAVIAVGAMSDLPRINIEMAVLSRPERTREKMIAICTELRGLIESVVHTHVAVRVTALDPETYIALK